MRLNNDNFFKNFNRDYLIFLDLYYKNKNISNIKNIIKFEIKKLQLKNNVKQIKERTVDYWLFEDGHMKIYYQK